MNEHEQFYKVLGLSPTATKAEIKERLQALRDKDVNMEYAAAIKFMERALLADNNKPNHAPDATEAPSMKSAQNIDTQSFDASPNTATPPDRIESSAPRLSLRVALLVIGSILALGILLMFAKPFYQNLQAGEQAKQAVSDLYDAKNQLTNYIKTHGHFPNEMTFPLAPTSPYRIVLAGQDLHATFTDNAAPHIRDKYIALQSITKPNVPLSWHCVPEKSFPEAFIPKNCL